MSFVRGRRNRGARGRTGGGSDGAGKTTPGTHGRVQELPRGFGERDRGPPERPGHPVGGTAIQPGVCGDGAGDRGGVSEGKGAGWDACQADGDQDPAKLGPGDVHGSPLRGMKRSLTVAAPMGQTLYLEACSQGRGRSSRVTTACDSAERPSPTGPTFSAVLNFTETRSISRLRASASRWRIAWR